MKVTVFSLKRINNSASGNPRYSVYTDQGTFNTAGDYGVNYMINNGWRGKDDREAEITLSAHGTITHLTYLDGEKG
jgi:hypothetical protein